MSAATVAKCGFGYCGRPATHEVVVACCDKRVQRCADDAQRTRAILRFWAEIGLGKCSACGRRPSPDDVTVVQL